jgi:hypothetical protein
MGVRLTLSSNILIGRKENGITTTGAHDCAVSIRKRSNVEVTGLATASLTEHPRGLLS